MSLSIQTNLSYVNDFSKKMPGGQGQSGSDQKVSAAQERNLKHSGKIECETCKKRKYKDGSDEMVSFKTPGHISPGASAGKVMSHEHEHVANAYSKAADKGGQVISASVSLKTSVCPECGRSYVSDGTTTTQIKYTEGNPYSANQKTIDYVDVAGMNFKGSVGQDDKDK